MPSESKKQHNLMEAVAHNAAFAKKAGIPQKVGREYAKEDAAHELYKNTTSKGRKKR